MTVDVSVLGKPITFRNGMKAPNVFLKSAMTERLCTYDKKDLEARGKTTAEYEKLYKVWGEGEIGVIVLGNIPIEREGLEAAKNMIIDKSNTWDAIENLKPVIAASKAHGSLVIGQLTHGGRQVSNEIVDTPVSASDIQCPPMGGMEFGKPRPLREDEIEDLIDRWAFGAEALYKAGADGCQLHAAHGYLLSQFLSSRVNKRTDKFGGSLENKSRIVFRVIEEIKKRVDTSKFLISIKMNSADFADGGLTEEESRTVAQQLDEAGLDLIELSGGSYESMAFEHKKESTKKREAFFIEFAEKVRPMLKSAVLCTTGGFRSAKAMVDAVNGGATAMIGLARPLCAEPYFCRDILSGKITEARENKGDGGISTGLAIMQLAAIGAGKDIPDLSDEKTVQKLVNVLMGKGDEDDKPIKDQESSSYAGQEKAS